jgi:hypothetical protein
VKGIQICSKEGDSPSPRGDRSESENALKILKNLLLHNQQPKINRTWYKLSLGERGIQVCSNKWAGPLQS